MLLVVVKKMFLIINDRQLVLSFVAFEQLKLSSMYHFPF